MFKNVEEAVYGNWLMEDFAQIVEQIGAIECEAVVEK